MSPEYLQEKMAAESGVVAPFAVASAKEESGFTAADNHPAESPRPSVVALKFGGSSLLGAERMVHAAGLVRASAQDSSAIVVVSAMKGVTDRLLSISRALEEGKLSHAQNEAEGVLHLHFDVLEDLELEEAKHDRVRRGLQLLGRDLLHEVPSEGRVAATPELADRLASFGERFSARLFAAALEESGVAAIPVSSSDFVLTCDTFRDAKPHLEETKQRGRAILLPLLEAGLVPVVTGFIGATPDGRITTLGRNSSDFSAAIVACAMRAHDLTIWTSVDGFFDADPNHVASAQQFEELSYEEALEHSQRGARVVHPKAFDFLMQERIPLLVRNAARPDAPGTWIGLREIGRQGAANGGSR
jgi:bifunctional aspartokinase / homoserine dehydrogenase 1